MFLITLLVDRVCKEKFRCTRFVSVVIVAVENNMRVFGPILSSFRNLFCVVIIGNIALPG